MVIRDALKPHHATLVPEAVGGSRFCPAGRCEPAPCGECPGGLRRHQRTLGVGGWEGGASPDPSQSGLSRSLARRPAPCSDTHHYVPLRQSIGTLQTGSWTQTPRTYAACFAIAQYHEPVTSPLFQAEIAKKLLPSWNDLPLDPSWTTPDPTLTGKIEAAQGMLTERFAFCQTMPMDEFLIDRREICGNRAIVLSDFDPMPRAKLSR